MTCEVLEKLICSIGNIIVNEMTKWSVGRCRVAMLEVPSGNVFHFSNGTSSDRVYREVET